MQPLFGALGHTYRHQYRQIKILQKREFYLKNLIALLLLLFPKHLMDPQHYKTTTTALPQPPQFHHKLHLLYVRYSNLADNLSLSQPEGTLHNQQMSLIVRKPVFRISDQVRHKFGCAATENSKRLKILDLESREIVLSMKRKQRR